MSDHSEELPRLVPAAGSANPDGALGERPSRASAAAKTDIVLEPKAITAFFATAATALVLLHTLAQFARFYLGLDMSNRDVVNVLELLHLSLEDNLPSYFSALMLLTCAALLLVIFLASRREGRPHSLAWAGLALVFTYLSADEMLAWHEYLVGPVRATLHTSGLFYFAWVIPYGVLVLLLALAMLRFYLWLPGRTRFLFALAAAVFLSGALGLEMLGGRYAELKELDTAGMATDPGLTVYQTVEETLEMAGVIIFIYALSSYIQATFDSLRICIGKPTRGGKHDPTQH